MARLLFLSLLIISFLNSTGISARGHGLFQIVSDIGNPKLKGDTHYDDLKQLYILSGSGQNMWADQDEFHFASVKLEGDFILTSFCHFEGKGVNPHRKMGLIIRENLEKGSRYADAAIHGDGLTSLQFRMKDNELTTEIKASLIMPDVIQLERKGDTIIMRCAKSGEPLSETGRISISFKAPVFVGLFVCSHDPGVTEKAQFQNFRIDVPAADNLDGYKHLSASRLEIMDVVSGVRKVIYATTGHIEAPNWSADGKFLIYNSGGLIYKFPLDTKNPKSINTGGVIGNNNDHGLSSDGKMLALSSTTKLLDGSSGSMIYTVPVVGGIPKAVTKKVPSYWHGWSPDGKLLVYCAERNGDYDIWGIPSQGGEEFQLTNSNKSMVLAYIYGGQGTMNVPSWSPDSKKIAFVSFTYGNPND